MYVSTVSVFFKNYNYNYHFFNRIILINLSGFVFQKFGDFFKMFSFFFLGRIFPFENAFFLNKKFKIFFVAKWRKFAPEKSLGL